MSYPCVFCEIVAGRADADIRERMMGCTCFVPLNPVTPGHLLVIPDEHVEDATRQPWTTGKTFEVASRIAQGDVNLITSVGPAATQTVRHLHVHIVPRHEDDGLYLPWTAREDQAQ